MRARVYVYIYMCLYRFICICILMHVHIFTRSYRWVCAQICASVFLCAREYFLSEGMRAVTLTYHISMSVYWHTSTPHLHTKIHLIPITTPPLPPPKPPLSNSAFSISSTLCLWSYKSGQGGGGGSSEERGEEWRRCRWGGVERRVWRCQNRPECVFKCRYDL